MNQKWVGYLQVVVASCGFGFLGIFAKLAYQNNISVGELLTARFALAGLLLFVGILIFKRDLFQISFKQMLISMTLGLTGYALFGTLYFLSIQGLSVPLAAMLLFTYPFFVTLFSHFFSEHKMTSQDLISVSLGFLGLVILLWGELKVESYFALLAGIGSSVSYAFYVLASARYQKNIAPLSSSLIVIPSAAMGLYLFHQPDLNQILQFNFNQWSIIAGLAIVSTIIPLTLFLSGLQKLKESEAALTSMVEPVIASLLSVLILGETLSFQHLFGIVIILFAIAYKYRM